MYTLKPGMTTIERAMADFAEILYKEQGIRIDQVCFTWASHGAIDRVQMSTMRDLRAEALNVAAKDL